MKAKPAEKEKDDDFFCENILDSLREEIMAEEGNKMSGFNPFEMKEMENDASNVVRATNGPINRPNILEAHKDER